MHTLIPALAARDGRPWAAFGTMGADGQPQIQAQVLVNIAERGLRPEQAVAEPRARVVPGGGGLWLEADHPAARDAQRSELEVTLVPPRSSLLGHAQALMLGGPQEWEAGADPRADGSVASSD